MTDLGLGRSEAREDRRSLVCWRWVRQQGMPIEAGTSFEVGRSGWCGGVAWWWWFRLLFDFRR